MCQTWWSHILIYQCQTVSIKRSKHLRKGNTKLHVNYQFRKIVQSMWNYKWQILMIPYLESWKPLLCYTEQNVMHGGSFAYNDAVKSCIKDRSKWSKSFWWGYQWERGIKVQLHVSLLHGKMYFVLAQDGDSIALTWSMKNYGGGLVCLILSLVNYWCPFNIQQFCIFLTCLFTLPKCHCNYGIQAITIW